MSDSDPEFAGPIITVFDEWINRVGVVVAAAQISGHIRTDISSEALAKNMIATIEGGIMRSRLTRERCGQLDCLRKR
ncbi:MAG: TetR family transcriptional regulator C-terminal domain-containing protein [Geobacteraceae bacterium]|nr:TetR family transcriptional regulator C-terminal domain-containing protein [Geobacteraceae bacterium]